MSIDNCSVNHPRWWDWVFHAICFHVSILAPTYCKVLSSSHVALFQHARASFLGDDCVRESFRTYCHDWSPVLLVKTNGLKLLSHLGMMLNSDLSVSCWLKKSTGMLFGTLMKSYLPSTLSPSRWKYSTSQIELPLLASIYLFAFNWCDGELSTIRL